MSWSIQPPEDAREKHALESAIAEAANADILMFCSASDKGPKENATYPAKATSKIFTIGAAKATGVADPWVGNTSNVSFIFPGTKVEVDGSPSGVTAPEEATGSSIATALAAGLAALILYCVQLRMAIASEDERPRARRDFESLKRHDGMMRALKDIGTTEASNYKFITVWEVFGKKVEEKDRANPEDWVHLVTDVGSMLCRKI